MGLLDTFNGDDLISLGSGLLSAGGPSRMPVSLGQAFAGGLQAMQAGQDKRFTQGLQRDQFDLQKSYKLLQEQQMQQQLAAALRKQRMQEQAMQMLPGLLSDTPQAPQAPQAPTAGQMPQSAPSMPNMPLLGNVNAGGDWNSINAQVRAQQPGRDASAGGLIAGEYGSPESAQGGLAELDKAIAQASGDAKGILIGERNRLAAGLGQGGQATAQAMQLQQQAPAPQPNNQQQRLNKLAAASAIMGLAEVPGHSGLMDLAKFQRPDIKEVDAGGSIIQRDAYGNVLGVIQKSMTPGEIATNQLGRDRLDFDKRKPSYHDGALVSPDGTITKTPMYAPPKGSPEAVAQSSAKVLPLIDEADKLLNSATGSYFGAAGDMAAAAFGKSTKGAQATAQLKALEGALMMAQPRMEGPQSDKDVALYRQMAGQIGDSTVPVETRRAALQGIKALHQKYTAGATPTEPQQQSASPIVGTGMYGGRKVVKFADGRIDYAD